MFVVTNNILAAPIIITIAILDAYVLLIAARVLLMAFPGMWARHYGACLRELTEPVMRALHKRLPQLRDRQIPMWLLWLIAIPSIVFLRQTLVHLVVNKQQGFSWP